MPRYVPPTPEDLAAFEKEPFKSFIKNPTRTSPDVWVKQFKKLGPAGVDKLIGPVLLTFTLSFQTCLLALIRSRRFCHPDPPEEEDLVRQVCYVLSDLPLNQVPFPQTPFDLSSHPPFSNK